MQKLSIGFIGFGLIGGSIARAVKEKHPEYPIYVFNQHTPSVNPSLKTALNDGTIDNIETYLDGAFCDCDLIFLCAPVLSNLAYLKKLKDVIKPSCIITDVGSVKGNIHQAVIDFNMQQNFIGGHPMAGSEKTGYENSSTRLLENAYYLLTPTKQVSVDMLNTMQEFITMIGAIPVILEPESHDDIAAAVSHVPHIIAAALVNMVKHEDDESEHMHTFAAGGFKDITRIASSSPELWQNICLSNRVSICKFLESFRGSLQHIENALWQQESDLLLQTFESASEYRNTIPSKSVGLITKYYELYVDIMDETGAIATIATILASNHISIKNIGIIHNREFQEGALRIELYDNDSSIKTESLLKQHNYRVFSR